jgi:Uma2 family endonuclease
VTEEDYFKLPETNRIIELSEGRLIITPSPTTEHQKILGNLYFVIKGYIMAKKLGEVVMSPMDVRLWKGNIRQPDIVYMSIEHIDRITKQYFGIPDLVVEMLSESTAKNDKEDKFYEYEKAGIPEYWIVDPETKTIEVFTLENGTYTPCPLVRGFGGISGIGETAKSKLLDGFEVSVDEIM